MASPSMKNKFLIYNKALTYNLIIYKQIEKYIYYFVIILFFSYAIINQI